MNTRSASQNRDQQQQKEARQRAIPPFLSVAAEGGNAQDGLKDQGGDTHLLRD
jgi:hypothetical protein